MHTSLLNTAALRYCLCCSDLVLFVDLFSLICFLSFDFVRVSGTMLYLGMNGMLGWAWVTFLDCIGSLVSAQVDGGAPIYVTDAIATPMHVHVRNGLPFHLCYFVRTFLTIKNSDIYFLPQYDGLFLPFFQFNMFSLDYLPFGLPNYPIMSATMRQLMISQPESHESHCLISFFLK